jgi:nucleotide-binding universal stress UspA family protein
MTAASWMHGPPKKILLATDMSPRCDRALDRAVSLSEQWQAELVVLHALEEPATDMLEAGEKPPSWRRPPDPVVVASKQLIADVGVIAKKAKIIIEEGDPVEVIDRLVEGESFDLVVTGVARNELFGRFGLGRTVDRLLRHLQVPLLVVKSRVREPYRRIVTAVDFSDSSRHALEAAAHIFPQQQLTVFHAYDAPMSGLMSDAESYQRESRNAAERDADAFLQAVKKPSGHWQPPQILIEYGSPCTLLRDYVGQQNVDLIVLGSHGRSAISEVLLGSVAKQIMDEVPCDTLMVREPRAAAEM